MIALPALTNQKKGNSLLLRGIAAKQKSTVIMPQKSPQQKFQFITEKYIKANFFQLTRWQAGKLREKLPRSIYWVQLAQGGQYHWNWTLLQDYLINGDRPEHQALVEEYLASLP